MIERQIKEMIELHTGFKHHSRINIVSDTSEFMSIRPDDTLELGGNYYLIRGEEYETRFGLEGEPKFWVKRAIDLSDGSSKIIKLVFHESVYMTIGEHRFRCYRSPQKEARILEKTKGDVHFMQGVTVFNRAENTIRMVDRIKRKCFYDYIPGLVEDHETYFFKHLPGILRNLVIAAEAIARLHGMGEVHGDIRTDHILIERETGRHRWIDFDYTYEWSENPFGLDLFGLGNILLFAVGKGFYPVQELRKPNSRYSSVLSSLRNEDFSLYSRNRIMNLRKLFPYVPERLNLILMHFAQGAEVFYETTEEFLEDLQTALCDLPHPEMSLAA
jgi:tRNA A-37 threonylcarbamoyl transferase component Bud32